MAQTYSLWIILKTSRLLFSHKYYIFVIQVRIYITAIRELPAQGILLIDPKNQPPQALISTHYTTRPSPLKIHPNTLSLKWKKVAQRPATPRLRHTRAWHASSSSLCARIRHFFPFHRPGGAPRAEIAAPARKRARRGKNKDNNQEAWPSPNPLPSHRHRCIPAPTRTNPRHLPYL